MIDVLTYFLNMNPFVSFILGPYGKAFAMMAEYQFLPTPESFTEFTEEMYEAYYNKMGMPAERMYQMNPGPHYKGFEILTVSKTEMKEILRAKLFVDMVTLNDQSLKGSSDAERLKYFMSQFTFLFPD